MADHWQNVKWFITQKTVQHIGRHALDLIDAALAAERSDAQARITALEQENHARKLALEMHETDYAVLYGECESLRSQLSAQTQEMEQLTRTVEHYDVGYVREPESSSLERACSLIATLTGERDALKEALEKGATR